MKTKNVFLAIIIFLLGSVSFFAQDKVKDPRCDFDVAKFKADRAEYFTKELKLTTEQSQSFLPILDEFMTKKLRVNKESRIQAYELRRKKNIEDTDYTKATEAYLEAKIKEAELQKEYYKKFRSVLSSKQLYKFSRVEINFMRKTLDKNKIEKNNKQKHRTR